VRPGQTIIVVVGYSRRPTRSANRRPHPVQYFVK
jgi:hypothetical protein